MWLLLSPLQSLSLAGLAAASFVLSLYVWRAALQANRDDPAVIKQRCASTLTLCALATVALWGLQWTPPQDSELGAGPPLSVWLGFPSHSYGSAFSAPLLLTMSLFLGPVVLQLLEVVLEAECGAGAGAGRSPTIGAVARIALGRFAQHWNHWNRWQSIRNLIVAPLCEELLFRGVILSLLVSGGFSFFWCVLLSPLLFGLAHLHHLVSLVRSRGVGVGQAVVMVTFQLGYTTIFGLYASALWLRTGHMVGAVLAHAWCNLMGFPELRFLDSRHPLHPKRHAILVAFVAGMVIFALSIVPLTDDQWLYSSALGAVGEKAHAHTGSWLMHYQRMQQQGDMDKYRV